MTQTTLAVTNPLPNAGSSQTTQTSKSEILCPHCLRTATNGIKCQGICVADSNY